MKISWSWLSRYVDLEGVDPVETGMRFTLSVAELEEIEQVGQGLEAVRIVKITAVEPHPNGQHLKLATIDLGDTSRVVVCGAPNAREGLFTALADVGARVYDKSGELFTVGEAEIRGVKSAGMLVSPMELGLSEDHAGVIELPDGHAPGTLLAEVAPLVDTIWDIDNKSITHRPDLWGHLGIAREVAALVGRELRFVVPRPAFTEADPLTVINEETMLCPRYTAFTMDGIVIAPSPLWMQILLYHGGQRPISNIVDFTNFVMMTLGNPLHAFDARQMGASTIRIRRAHDGEPMTTLDGEKHTLSAEDLVIADAERPVALAGVMGGLNSEVEPDTSSVILESANFHPGRIRRTAARLGIRTESSARFEKSLDPRMAREAGWYFAQLVTDHIPGAHVTSRFYDEGAPLPKECVIELTADFIRARLGVELSDDRIVEILSSLSFEVGRTGGDLRVTVPSFRATKDVGIPEDIVEEVGRIHGYGNIPATKPMIRLEKPWTLPTKSVERRIRDTLALEMGFNEAMTYSFDRLANLEKSGLGTEAALWLKNPISKEEPVLRQTLLLNLIDAVKRNERTVNDQRLFETGRIFIRQGEGELPLQPRKLGAVVAARGGRQDASAELFFNLKYVLERLAQRLERGDFSLGHPGKETLGLPWVHPARCGDVHLGGVRVGYMAALHPAVAAALQVKSDLVLADLDLDAVAALSSRHRLFEPLPRFPGIEHDISVIVDKKRSAAEISALLDAVDPLVARVACVDMYEGEKFPGRRSLTFRLLFAHQDRTLTQEEVQSIHEKIVHLVNSQLGGSILG